MEFLNLDFGEVSFNKINHFVEYTGIMVWVGGEEGAAEPGGLPDVLQANLRRGEVEFLVQACEDGRKQRTLLLQRSAAWERKFESEKGNRVLFNFMICRWHRMTFPFILILATIIINSKTVLGNDDELLSGSRFSELPY